MRFLIFTTDVPPLEGLPTSGTALRTWGLSQGLRAHGHEVILSVPKPAIEGCLRLSQSASRERDLPEATLSALREFSRLSFDSFNQQQIVAETGPECIICGHWPAMIMRTKPSQMLVVDLAGPHLLERHYQGLRDFEAMTINKLSVIASADYFIVSGNSQRLYFLSFMLRSGVPSPEQRIVTIPMPLNPRQPEPKPKTRSGLNYPHFLFGGVFLPWQDPSWGLSTVSKFVTERGAGRLTLVGGTHPNYPINSGTYTELFKELESNSFVQRHPMLPLEEFVKRMSEADVALDLMRWNLERQLAMTIRSTTYLWAGLPIIYNDYADLSQLIRRYDAGWCVAPGDEPALRKVFDDICSSPELVERKSVNASRLAADIFSWDKAVTPLLELIESPAQRVSREVDIILDFPQSADFPLSKEKRIQQYFLSRSAGLSKIEFRIATHGGDSKQTLMLRLYEVDFARDFYDIGKTNVGATLPHRKRKLISERTIEPGAYQNNQWVALDIKPIPDSAGRCFALEIESGSNELNSAESDSLGPWIVKASPYPMLGLFYGQSELKSSSLVFRTTCAWVQ